MTMDRTIKRTIKLKLSVSEEYKEILKQTITLFNTVFNYIAQYGFEHNIHSKVSIHHATYKQIREMYPELPSSLVQGARDVACEALKVVEIKRIPSAKSFSSISSIIYNQRVITYYLKYGRVSIATINGRIKATFNIPEHSGNIVLGVDRGIVNIAVCSNNVFFNDIFALEDLTSIRV